MIRAQHLAAATREQLTPTPAALVPAARPTAAPPTAALLPTAVPTASARDWRAYFSISRSAVNWRGVSQPLQARADSRLEVSSTPADRKYPPTRAPRPQPARNNVRNHPTTT